MRSGSALFLVGISYTVNMEIDGKTFKYSMTDVSSADSLVTSKMCDIEKRASNTLGILGSNNDAK